MNQQFASRARPSRASVIARTFVMVALAGGIGLIGVRATLYHSADTDVAPAAVTGKPTVTDEIARNSMLGMLDLSWMGPRAAQASSVAVSTPVTVAQPVEDPMHVWEYYPLPEDRPEVEPQPPTF